MAHRKYDLVQETSTSTGTGAMALAGAPTRRRTFGSVLSNADTCYVLIENASAAEWEICLATYATSGNQLTRGAVLASSTGSAVSFSAGTKTISLIAPASKMVVEDNNGDASVTRRLGVGGAATYPLDVINALAGSHIARIYNSDTSGSGATMLRVDSGGRYTELRAAYSGQYAQFYTSGLTSFYYDCDAHIFRNGAASEYARLNSTGLGIGVSPTEKLTIGGSAGTALYARWTNGTQVMAAGISAGNLPLIGTLSNDPLLFFANNSEVMRYTPAAGLGIGGAATAGTSAILTLAGDLGLNTGGRSLLANLYYDGAWKYYANGYGWGLRPNGSGLLQILTASNNAGGAGAAATQTARISIDQANGHVLAGADNTQTLGGASNRWSTVYAGTGTINTSGADSKVGIRAPLDAERRAARRILNIGPKLYQFRDAYDAKGEAARLHAGYIAEDVRDALEAEGLNPWRYGFMCADEIMATEEYVETVERTVRRMESITVPVERQKLRKIIETVQAIEMRDGRAVMVNRTVEREEPVGQMVPVYDESGAPVMVPMGQDDDGNAILQPLLHFLPEVETVEEVVEREVEVTETVEETRTREVPTGEKRLGLRYSELEAFLKCATAE